LRFLFASRPAVMGAVLGIVYPVIATHLVGKAGFSTKSARTGAVTLIQRFGSAARTSISTFTCCFSAACTSSAPRVRSLSAG
jgi:hypothetical protein